MCGVRATHVVLGVPLLLQTDAWEEREGREKGRWGVRVGIQKACREVRCVGWKESCLLLGNLGTDVLDGET